jgi:tRNA-Thr(GGU) m(6)t(6)A37 methyltransferase TsaA
MLSEPFHFQQIGHVESCFKERFGTPRQPGIVPLARAQLVIQKEFMGALEGLESFSHLWVIFVFHQNTNKTVKLKIHPPRLKGEKIGVFASRSPHRPNPIGLSVVRVLNIEGNIVTVGGVDFIEGTPILDLKPYLVSFDSVSEASQGWLGAKPLEKMPVAFSEESLLKIKSYSQKSKYHSENELKELIKQTLELDPRPNFYKGSPENPDPYMDQYGFCLEDFNVVFKMKDGVAHVIDLIEDFKK